MILFGGNGKSRTFTGHRMRVLHYHYATLPYKNTLMARLRLSYNLHVTGPNVFLYGGGKGTRTR